MLNPGAEFSPYKRGRHSKIDPLEIPVDGSLEGLIEKMAIDMVGMYIPVVHASKGQYGPRQVLSPGYGHQLIVAAGIRGLQCAAWALGADNGMFGRVGWLDVLFGVLPGIKDTYHVDFRFVLPIGDLAVVLVDFSVFPF